MSEFLRQIVFTQDNIAKFYLSPYCEVYITDEHIYLEREGASEYLCFNCNNGKKESFLQLLENLADGMKHDELENYLKLELGELAPDDWITCGVQGGILE
jgi:hypothetical protein